VPDTKKEVSMYCCGPTVYRDAHVGNLRTFLLSDLIRRVIEIGGTKVKVIQNITDVGHMADDAEIEDKVIAQATLEKIAPFEIARKYEVRFHADLERLNIRKADSYPRASECIEMMHKLISTLIEQGFAYVGSDQSVYFNAHSFATYGAISGNKLDSLKPGHRYQYSDDGGKKFHADWALWKNAANRTEMIWDSPWGVGFPGWHIECSAMSLNFLNSHVDIHVGGIDLRFPHHENERAQSNAITKNEAVDIWVHGEHLLFEGRKMAKSSGNVVLLQDLIDKNIDPLALRLCFMENRYRTQMDLTWDSIAAAQITIKRWRKKMAQWGANFELEEDEEMISALENDLDLPRLLQRIRAIEKDERIPDVAKRARFNFAEQVLALDLHRVQRKAPLTPAQQNLLSKRDQARKEQRWSDSDLLRIELEKTGLEIRDLVDGQEWDWR